MSRGRAYRRSAKAKRKVRAVQILRKWERDAADLNLPGCAPVNLATPRRIGRMAVTGTVCSCYMCGNPRRHFNEKSVQEMRQTGK